MWTTLKLQSSESWPFSFEGLCQIDRKKSESCASMGALSCWNLDGNIILKHQRIQASSPTSGQSEGSMMIFIKKMILFDGGRHVGASAAFRKFYSSAANHIAMLQKLPHGHDESHEELRWNTIRPSRANLMDAIPKNRDKDHTKRNVYFCRKLEFVSKKCN